MAMMPVQGPAEEEQEDAAIERDPSRYTDEGDSGVTPEEQAQYSQFEQNYLKLMYTPDGKVQPGLLESLNPNGAPAEQAAQAPQQPQGGGLMGDAAQQPDDDQPTEGAGGNPAVTALAHTGVTIVEQLDDSARKAGKPLSDDVLQHGGEAVIEELADIAGDAKLHDYTPEEISGALTMAMDMYRPKAIADGRTSEDELKNQWGEIVKADQEGRIGDVVPGIQE